MKRSINRTVSAFVLALPLTLATLTGQAKVESENGEAAKAASPALVFENTVSLQCWQGGVSVYQAEGLKTASVVPLLPATSQAAANGNVGLRSREANGVPVTLVPLGDALCLIRGSGE